MRRVCFLGSSHVAAVKMATDMLKAEDQLRDVAVTIFGSQSGSLRAAKVGGGLVYSDDTTVQERFQWTSGGMTDLKISDYDDIFVLARSSFFASEFFQVEASLPVMSRALIEAVLEQRIKTDWAIHLAKDIAAENRQVRVSYVGSPLRSDASPVAQSILAAFHDPQSGFAARVDKLRRIMAEMAETHSTDNFTFLPPPAAALEKSGLFTQHVFCQNSLRLTKEMDVAHPNDDYRHMNATYGKILLAHALA